MQHAHQRRRRQHLQRVPAARLPLAACAMAAALLLAGCGGGSDAPPEVPPLAMDATPPTLSISHDLTDAVATGPVLLTFSFSENVGISFTAGDIIVSGGTKVAFTRLDGMRATLLVRPTANATGDLVVTVPAGAFADGAGNTNTASANLQQAFDTTASGPEVTQTVLADFDALSPVEINVFGGAVTTVEAGPAGGSGQALKIVRNGGEPWAGAWMPVVTLPAPAGAATFTATITARVYAPAAGVPMVAKIEYADNVGSGDTPASAPIVQGWQTVTWVFSNLVSAQAYNRFVILPNLGTVDSNQAYFIDDITLVVDAGGEGGGGGGPTLNVIGFESPELGLTPFEGLGGASVVDDPVAAGNKVLRMVKAPTGQPWAGATVFTVAANQSVGPIGFANGLQITLRVYSPAAGRPIMIKVEDSADGRLFMEKIATTTVAGAWETLTFDFASPSNGSFNGSRVYDRISLFPNFMTVPAADEVYFFDDLSFPAGG